MHHDPLHPPDIELERGPGLAPDALDRLLAGVEEQVSTPRPLDRARELATPLRVALLAAPGLLAALALVGPHGPADVAARTAVGALALFAAVAARGAARGVAAGVAAFAVALALAAPVPEALGAAWQLRTALGGAAIAGALAVGAQVLLRPLRSPPLGHALAALVLAPALGLLIAAQPDEHWHLQASAALHVHCLEIALQVGLVTAAAAWLLARDDLRWSPERLIGGAAAGGAAGFLVVHLTCPISALDHVLLAHASTGVLLATVGAAVALAARRLAR